MAGQGRQGGVRKPATKLPHLRKKLSKTIVRDKIPRKK